LGVVQTDEQIEQLKSLVASVPMGRMGNSNKTSFSVYCKKMEQMYNKLVKQWTRIDFKRD
jgi:hypothetical protein